MRSGSQYFEEEELRAKDDAGLLKRIYPFVKPYKLLLVLSVFLALLITLVDLSIPYITKVAIDRYIVPHEESYSHSEEQLRFYDVKLSGNINSEIVEKYSEYFQIKDGVASIPFDELGKIEKEDLLKIRSGDLKGVGRAALILLFAVLTSFIFHFVQVNLMEYMGQNIMYDLRITLFDHIQKLPVSYFTKNPVGRLVTRVTGDVSNMHEMFTSVITFIFKDLFLLAGIIIILFSLNWKLALACFVIFPFVIYASVKFASVSRGAFRTLRVKMAEINTMFAETIGGMKVVQLFSQEENNYDTFKKLNHENYMAGMKQVNVFAVFMPVIETFGALTLAIVIFYGGGKVLGGSLSLGVLVAFISYMKMFFRPVRDIAEKYNIMQNAFASAERIFLVLDTRVSKSIEDETEDKKSLRKINELSFENVDFSYLKGEEVLKDVSFGLKAGETVAVVGPTGAGKTSIINLIVRFYEPEKGNILVNGQNISDYSVSSVRSSIALVMQDPFLFSGSIRENITCGNNSNISDDEMDRILELSNCKGFIEKLPDGVDSLLSEGGQSISSGERQLISIARAIATDPGLIILDEATSYIDSGSELVIQEALENLMKGRASIVIAHRLSTARTCDRIIVLNKGEIAEVGNHEELMEKRGLYFGLNMTGNL